MIADCGCSPIRETGAVQATALPSGKVVRSRPSCRRRCCLSQVPSAAVPPPAVLHNIDWLTYSRMLRILQRRRFRLTYDRGTLEIMAPLLAHDGPADLLDWFIKVMIEELKLPSRPGRTVTLRQRRRRRGLEPDCCYWIASAPRLLGKREVDLRVDPPPDLAVEVDVTSSSLDRMSIYA